MHKVIRRFALSAALLSVFTGGASAQTPPGALAVVPGLTYEGQIGGMDVWSMPGVSDLFAVSPDGRTLVRGAIFSGSGRDIGAALTGSEPSTLVPDPESIGDVSPREKIERNDSASPAGGALMVNTNPMNGFAGLGGQNSCQSPIASRESMAFIAPPGSDEGRDQAALLSQGSPPFDDPKGSEPAIARDQSGLINGAEIAREAQDALAGFSQDERRDILLNLVAGLRETQTQEEFLSAIASWRADVDRMRMERGLPRLYSDDGKEPLQTTSSGVEDLTGLTAASIETSTLPPLPFEGGEIPDEVPLEQVLLEDSRYNALWFSVGANDAPSVYAFIDPTCTYSARAISALSEEIGSGDLQLRVILAPILSQRSAGLIAGILTNDRPPLAFFDHEVDLAERGRSDLAPAEFSTLPAPVQAGIQRNFEMLKDYGIPGVPFFVYETADGARVLSGAPEGISFPGALNDTYTGTK